MGLGQDVLTRLPRALACEWVVSNGLGGSASGTAAGALTRSTHAALAVMARGVPVAMLLKLDDRGLTDEGPFDLACVVQPNGTARPAGHRLLEAFGVEPWPTWRYRLGSSVIEKTLMLVWGHDAVVVSYRHLEGPPVRLTASPVVVSRPLFELPVTIEPPCANADAKPGRAAGRNSARHAEGNTPRGRDPGSTPGPVVQGMPGRVCVQLAEESPLLTLWHNGVFMPGRAWSRVRYMADDRSERAFMPGYVEGAVMPGMPLHVVAATEPALFRTLAREARLGDSPPRTLAECVQALENDERERLGEWKGAARVGALVTAQEAAQSRKRDTLPDSVTPAAWTDLLTRALDAGLVRRGTRLTVASVLPHGEERGADALRAVLGLLAIRSFDTARDIVRGYVEYLNEGLAPERFEADGTPVYGDAEAALWLVIAGERYARRSGDREFASGTLYPALEEMMRHYRSGAPGGIRVDSDGLLMTLPLGVEAGAEAELDTTPGKNRALAEPGTGARGRGAGGASLIKRADLNALWYHAYVAMSQLARNVGRKENAAFYLAWAHEHHVRFNERFWNNDAGCLYEALVDDSPVAGLGPSQLWAASFAPALLEKAQALALVDTIERELVTPFGLKPSPDAESARVEWLGPFLSANVRAHGRSPTALARARERIGAVCEWMAHEGLGGLPESCGVRQAEAAPSGDRASVSPPAASSLLRVWVEDLEHAAEEARVR